MALTNKLGRYVKIDQISLRSSLIGNSITSVKPLLTIQNLPFEPRGIIKEN
jgi:hypothetical protein